MSRVGRLALAGLLVALDGHAVAIDGDNPGERGVGQAARLVVGRPAYAVARPQVKILLLGQLEAIACLGRRQFLRIETYSAAAFAQLDLAIGVDGQDIVAPGAEPYVLAAAPTDLERHAGAVGGRVAQFLARRVDPLIDREVDALPFQRSFGGKTRLELLQEATANMLNTLALNGDVRVMVVGFTTNATAGTEWLNVADAIAAINALTPANLTNYEDALNDAEDAFQITTGRGDFSACRLLGDGHLARGQGRYAIVSPQPTPDPKLAATTR